MRNILLVVDALANTYIKNNKDIDIIMPFLSSLRKDYTKADNVFSQGPYTEAALTPLITGNDNMANGGNFYRGKNEKTNIYKSFKEAGYNTFAFSQPVIYPSSQCDYLTDNAMGVTFFFSALWDYRLGYYADLKASNSLTNEDIEKCMNLLEDNLVFWENWIKMFIDNTKEVQFYKMSMGEDIDYQKLYKQVKLQKEMFLNDKKTYLLDLLEIKQEHPLFKIQNIEMNKKSENKAFDYIKSAYPYLIERINKAAKKSAKNTSNLGKIAKESIRETKLNGVKTAVNDNLHKVYYLKSKSNKKPYFEELFKKQSMFKNEPSMNRYFKYFLDWEEDKENYYANVHISDIHVPPIFFTIESDDLREIDDEIKVADNLIDALPTDFDGDVIYALSMRYIDYQLEKFIKKLIDRNGIDKYNIIITADHGNSFNYLPLRNRLVNNMYEENYTIPFVYLGKERKDLDDSKFYTSKDIVKTFLDLNNIDSSMYTGKDILKDEGDDYAITEYMGSGCPDIERRDVFFIIRDKKYAVSYSVNIHKDFEEGTLNGVFNLEEDPKELNNLKKSLDKKEYAYLLNKLKDRFEVIKKEALN